MTTNYPRLLAVLALVLPLISFAREEIRASEPQEIARTQTLRKALAAVESQTERLNQLNVALVALGWLAAQFPADAKPADKVDPYVKADNYKVVKRINGVLKEAARDPFLKPDTTNEQVHHEIERLQQSIQALKKSLQAELQKTRAAAPAGK